jgi:hypothetical protein
MNPVLEQVSPETIELLAAQAQAHGLSVDAFLKRLLGMPEQNHALAALSEEEFATLMEEFSSGTEGLPPLPVDFSRKDIYVDHD